MDKIRRRKHVFYPGTCEEVLLANTSGMIFTEVSGLAKDNIAVMTAWLGAFAYMFQIYFDFSGYSDMAIGLGKMFGFEFNMNFNYPYVSKSITEFWRRWHISLGSWFRDYVYIPLGGSRVKTWTLCAKCHSCVDAYRTVAWRIMELCLMGSGFGVLLLCERFLWGNG